MINKNNNLLNKNKNFEASGILMLTAIFIIGLFVVFETIGIILIFLYLKNPKKIGLLIIGIILYMLSILLFLFYMSEMNNSPYFYLGFFIITLYSLIIIILPQIVKNIKFKKTDINNIVKLNYMLFDELLIQLFQMSKFIVYTPKKMNYFAYNMIVDNGKEKIAILTENVYLINDYIMDKIAQMKKINQYEKICIISPIIFNDYFKHYAKENNIILLGEDEIKSILESRAISDDMILNKFIDS